MALSYPQDVKSSSDLVKGDFAADQYRGKSRLDGLVDIVLLSSTFTIDVPVTGGSVTTAAPSWQTLYTGTIVIPHFVEAALLNVLTVRVNGNMGGGSQSGSLRVNLSGITADAAYEVAVTETSPTEKTVESTPTTDGDLDALSRITWTLEGNVDNGAWTMTVGALDGAVYWDAV